MIELLDRKEDFELSKNIEFSIEANYKPKLDHRTPYRNLYLSVVSNAFNQLLEPLYVEVRVRTRDVSKLSSVEKPTSLDLIWDFKVLNDMEYKMAYSWLLSEDRDHIFSFINCCENINIDRKNIIKRANFIDDIRLDIISKVLDNKEDLKNIIRRKGSIYSKFKEKFNLKPNKEEYTIVDLSRKTISDIINRGYREKFEINITSNI